MVMSWLDYDIFSSYAIGDYPILPIHRLTRILGFAVLFRLISWTSCYLFHLQQETAFRIASTSHASIAFWGSMYLFTFGAQPFYPVPNTYCVPIPYAERLFCVSYGYFVYDLYKNITKHGGPAFILHGIFCIIVYSLFTFQSCAQRAGMACLLYEGSTIWLHTYAFLYYNGFTKLAGYARLIFAVIFFVVRIVFGLYITFESFDVMIFRRVFWNVDTSCCPYWPVITGLSVNVLFHVLNFYWFGKIVEKALESFKGGKVVHLEKGKELDFDKYRNAALKNEKNNQKSD